MAQVQITGMSCQHCVATIQKELTENGGKNVHVDLKNASATWEGELAPSKAVELINDLGFSAKE